METVLLLLLIIVTEAVWIPIFLPLRLGPALLLGTVHVTVSLITSCLCVQQDCRLPPPPLSVACCQILLLSVRGGSAAIMALALSDEVILAILEDITGRTQASCATTDTGSVTSCRSESS